MIQRIYYILNLSLKVMEVNQHTKLVKLTSRNRYFNLPIMSMKPATLTWIIPNKMGCLKINYYR
ncbi:hypothetical protein SDC9_106072 [bioreactor metagenome]|uniref:Uncharacterized protein n=1 Tax=bioreactor metagenome TaxID=1076179 RepID=A0A645B1A3_9ZZZZ